jgi:hypothetical protein
MTTFQGNPGNGTHTGNGEGGSFGHRVDRIGTDAQQLFTDARGAVTDLSATLDLKGRVERNPYGMIAAALGVGYILGGGLFTPTTARLIRLGVRLSALPFVKDELLNMAQTALSGFQAGAEAVGGSGGMGTSSTPPGGMGTSGGTNRPGV